MIPQKYNKKRFFQFPFNYVVSKIIFWKIAAKSLRQNKKQPKAENKLCFRSKFCLRTIKKIFWRFWLMELNSHFDRINSNKSITQLVYIKSCSLEYS